ncbi:uncharacterized protein LOC133663038 [Entelurus aequoreus]|uniref:uncharacterized protein LOC133663038 n=1 Tax=Entelurus aequoreus TaxID=161455 RepID=UPI002B1E4434|nr:uncharacterized protein LOC133663038 [Entelurus aequoreus]
MTREEHEKEGAEHLFLGRGNAAVEAHGRHDTHAHLTAGCPTRPLAGWRGGGGVIQHSPRGCCRCVLGVSFAESKGEGEGVVSREASSRGLERGNDVRVQTVVKDRRRQATIREEVVRQDTITEDTVEDTKDIKTGTRKSTKKGSKERGRGARRDAYPGPGALMGDCLQPCRCGGVSERAARGGIVTLRIMRDTGSNPRRDSL